MIVGDDRIGRPRKLRVAMIFVDRTHAEWIALLHGLRVLRIGELESAPHPLDPGCRCNPWRARRPQGIRVEADSVRNLPRALAPVSEMHRDGFIGVSRRHPYRTLNPTPAGIDLHHVARRDA